MLATCSKQDSELRSTPLLCSGQKVQDAPLHAIQFAKIQEEFATMRLNLLVHNLRQRLYELKSVLQLFRESFYQMLQARIQGNEASDMHYFVCWSTLGSIEGLLNTILEELDNAILGTQFQTNQGPYVRESSNNKPSSQCNDSFLDASFWNRNGIFTSLSSSSEALTNIFCPADAPTLQDPFPLSSLSLMGGDNNNYGSLLSYNPNPDILGYELKDLMSLLPRNDLGLDLVCETASFTMPDSTITLTSTDADMATTCCDSQSSLERFPSAPNEKQICVFPWSKPTFRVNQIDDQSHRAFYSCNLCNRRFRRKAELRRHMRSKRHRDLVGERPSQELSKQYHCDQCDKAFSRMDSMRRHKKTHIVRS